MTTTPARDALYDALITGTQHAQIRQHLIDAALEEDRATHAAEVRAAGLTESEIRFLTFALDLAADRMLSEDGFTGDDEAALESLRRMAAAARPKDTTGA